MLHSSFTAHGLRYTRKGEKWQELKCFQLKRAGFYHRIMGHRNQLKTIRCPEYYTQALIRNNSAVHECTLQRVKIFIRFTMLRSRGVYYMYAYTNVRCPFLPVYSTCNTVLLLLL